MIKTALALLLVKSIIMSFEYNETNPAMLFPYPLSVSDNMPLGNLSNPAYLPRWETFYLNTDYARPYSMSGLNSGNIRAGWCAGGIAAQAGWSRFGIAEYCEDIFNGSIGYMPWKFLSAGAGASYYHVNFNTEEYTCSRGLTDYKISLLAMPFEWIDIGFMYLNIYSAFKKERDDLTYPGWSSGVSVKPAAGITFSWNTTKSYYDYINTFAVSANLLPFLNLRAGYSRETSSFAASVIILYKNITVSYGLSHHTYLGLTHKFGITLSGRPLTLEGVNYNEKLFREKLPAETKKININRSTAEELREAGIFPDPIPERIIRFREALGPLNRDALIKIGVEPERLKEIEGMITGFIDAPDAGRATRTAEKTAQARTASNKKFIDLDERKILFRKMLESGFSASESLMITELARNRHLEDLLCSIRSLADIPDDKKKAIIKICAESL